MTEALTFTHMLLDRASGQRKSLDWLKEKIDSHLSCFIPSWQGDYLFIEQKMLALNVDELQLTIEQIAAHSYLLGIEKETDVSVFILDLFTLFKHQDDALQFVKKCLGQQDETIAVKGFRQVLPLLTNLDIANLGYGRALSLWHHSALHCGHCGGATDNHEAGHCRTCRNADCQKPNFPRTDPVVIMLVEHKIPGEPARCLLAGHHRSPDNLVSTLAGFVDPGESLEQAVIREVYEEAGIKVSNVKYVASQPWPFPNSLMIGFFAQAINDDINVDQQELRHARWFDAQQVENFSNWGDDDDNIQIPRKESIARHLIDLWLSQNRCDD